MQSFYFSICIHFFPVISISIRPQRELLLSDPASIRWDIIYWKWAQGMITREKSEKKTDREKMSTKKWNEHMCNDHHSRDIDRHTHATLVHRRKNAITFLLFLSPANGVSMCVVWVQRSEYIFFNAFITWYFMCIYAIWISSVGFVCAPLLWRPFNAF